MRVPHVFARLFALSMLASCAAPSPNGVVVRLPSGDCGAGASCAFDFGTITGEKTVAFDVVNPGDDTALVGAEASSNADDGAFALVQAPANTIAPRSSSPLVIFAKAKAPAAVSLGVLDVRFKTGDVVGTINAKLSATAAADSSETCPPLLPCTMPDTPVGQVARCEIALKNGSTRDELVDSIVLNGGGFSVPTLPLPIVIAPLDTVALELTATPSTIGANDASLTLQCGTLVESTVVTVNGT